MSLHQPRRCSTTPQRHKAVLIDTFRFWTAQLPRSQRHRAPFVCHSQLNFVVYTKPECPLCDGLKDKIQGLIDRAQFMPCFLTHATLEVRDISTNEAWQDAMHLSVPVLALLDNQGREVILPRPQPRITADRLQKHLEEAINVCK